MEQALSLPYATLRFAQLGWRVIRVEATGGKVELVGVDYNDDSAAKAAEQTSAVLQRVPDLSGVFGANLFSAEGILLNITIEASKTLALLGLVAAGLGVTVYPESLIGFLGRSVEVRPIIEAWRLTPPPGGAPVALAWTREEIRRAAARGSSPSATRAGVTARSP